MKYTLIDRKTSAFPGVDSLSTDAFVKFWAEGTKLSIYKYHPVNIVLLKPTETTGVVEIHCSIAIKEKKDSPIFTKEFLTKAHDALWDSKLENENSRPYIAVNGSGDLIFRHGTMICADYDMEMVDASSYITGSPSNVLVLDKLYRNITLNNSALMLVKDTDLYMTWGAIAQAALAALAQGWFEYLVSESESQEAWMTIVYNAPKTYELAKTRFNQYTSLKNIVKSMRVALDKQGAS